MVHMYNVNRRNCSASFPNTSPISWTPSYRRHCAHPRHRPFPPLLFLVGRSLHNVPADHEKLPHTPNGITIHSHRLDLSRQYFLKYPTIRCPSHWLLARRHASSSILALCSPHSLHSNRPILLPLYRQASHSTKHDTSMDPPHLPHHALRHPGISNLALPTIIPSPAYPHSRDLISRSGNAHSSIHVRSLHLPINDSWPPQPKHTPRDVYCRWATLFHRPRPAGNLERLGKNIPFLHQHLRSLRSSYYSGRVPHPCRRSGCLPLGYSFLVFLYQSGQYACRSTGEARHEFSSCVVVFW